MKTTDINTLTPDQLLKRVQELEIQLNRLADDKTVPVLVQIGTVASQEAIVNHLTWIEVSPDHLMVVSEMITNHMWKEMEYGTPNGKKERIIKEVQRDIMDMYEMATIAQYLKGTEQ